jgi:hypothetical protein
VGSRGWGLASNMHAHRRRRAQGMNTKCLTPFIHAMRGCYEPVELPTEFTARPSVSSIACITRWFDS